ncbi:MAG: hypothetical protein AMXMBFR48_24140 [Ignavibacteriales bacterium]
MFTRTNVLSLIAIFFFTVSFHAQDAKSILEKVKDRYNKIQDYSADITVDIDIDFLKTPKVTGKLFFKQPNKMKIKSDGFALLPKEGFNISPASLLKDNYTSIYEKEEIIDGVKLARLKVIPLGDSSNVILSTVWVDNAHAVIRKIESTTKNSGTFTITLSYNQGFLSKFPLPSSMEFNFDVSSLNIPRGFTSEPPKPDDKKKDDKDKLTKGSVLVTYKNYKVNSGLSDSVFQDEDKKQKQ